jgi:hypothetical protein
MFTIVDWGSIKLFSRSHKKVVEVKEEKAIEA